MAKTSLAHRQSATLSLDPDGTLRCAGAWRMFNVPYLELQLARVSSLPPGKQIWEMGGVTSMDTAGAWLVRRSLTRLKQKGALVELHGLRPEFDQLIRWVSTDEEGAVLVTRPERRPRVDRLGQAAWDISLPGLPFRSF